MLNWWDHWRAKETYTRTILNSRTPTYSQHKESIPSLLHSPSGPAFPFSAIQGLWRRNPTLQLCPCGFQPPGLSSKPSPHPCSQHSPKTNHCIHAINQLSQLKQGKRLQTIYSSPKAQQHSQLTTWGSNNPKRNSKCNHNMRKDSSPSWTTK